MRLLVRDPIHPSSWRSNKNLPTPVYAVSDVSDRARRLTAHWPSHISPAPGTLALRVPIPRPSPAPPKPKEVPMAKLKFRPLHDRVVVKRIDADDKSKGGIIIPDTAKEKPMQGEFVAVVPGGRDESGKLIPLDLKSGDRVLFGKWSGTEVKLDVDELLIIKERAVFLLIA